MTLPASGLLRLSQIRDEYSPTTSSYALSAYAKYLGKSVGAALAMSEFYGKSSPHGVVAILSSTPGSGSLFVPYGVTQARVYAHGAGGGGGGTSAYYGFFIGSGGGSGGRNSWPDIIDVTPGGSLPYAIGAGGVGGLSSLDVVATNGSNGGGTFAGPVSVSGGGGGLGNTINLLYVAGGAAGTPNGVAGNMGYPTQIHGAYAAGGNTGYGAGIGGQSGFIDAWHIPNNGIPGGHGYLRVEWV